MLHTNKGQTVEKDKSDWKFSKYCHFLILTILNIETLTLNCETFLKPAKTKKFSRLCVSPCIGGKVQEGEVGIVWRNLISCPGNLFLISGHWTLLFFLTRRKIGCLGSHQLLYLAQKKSIKTMAVDREEEYEVKNNWPRLLLNSLFSFSF